MRCPAGFWGIILWIILAGAGPRQKDSLGVRAGEINYVSSIGDQRTGDSRQRRQVDHCFTKKETRPLSHTHTHMGKHLKNRHCKIFKLNIFRPASYPQSLLVLLPPSQYVCCSFSKVFVMWVPFDVLVVSGTNLLPSISSLS